MGTKRIFYLNSKTCEYFREQIVRFVIDDVHCVDAVRTAQATLHDTFSCIVSAIHFFQFATKSICR